jgi:ABC-type nitrate/sulfonate/bicarbonate transport system permease component
VTAALTTTSPAAAAGGGRRVRAPKKPLVERRITGVVAPLVVVAVVLVAWEITGHFISTVLISSPQRVAQDFWDMLFRGTITSALTISLRELYIGLAIGVAAGILLGLIIGRYSLLDSISSPFINAANATPLNVLIPLLIVWVGIDSKARILFVVLISFFPVLLNTAGGLRNVSKGYVEVGETLGLNERQLMRKIVLPASVPYIFAGIRIGAALGVIGMIVGEMEVSNVGIGYLDNFYGEGFQTGNLLALVFLSALIGVFNVMVVRGVQYRWFKWITAAR